MVFRLYIACTAISFIGLLALAVAEVHVRWSLNQNFSFLDNNGLLGIAIVVAAQMLGLVWLLRSRD